MGNYLILLTALLPIAILVCYIYYKDKRSLEPTGLLMKALIFIVFVYPLAVLHVYGIRNIKQYPVEVVSVNVY